MVACKRALRRPVRRLRLESLETRALLNVAPIAPVIREPATAGQVLSGADVHMEIAGFSDPDPGDTHAGTAWEIWTNSGTIERVWSFTPLGGVELAHTHLGDGVFENSLAGRRELFPERDYQLRVRVRDSSGIAASEWSPYSTRSFVTAALSQLFPMTLEDILTGPAPQLSSAQSSTIELPAGAVPARIVAEAGTGENLLEIAGQDGIGNAVVNPAGLSQHVKLRVRLVAGSGNLVLPESDLAFTNDDGVRQTIYLPGVSLTPGEEASFWVSTNGSTFVATAGQTTPDLSTLARGAPVPWSVADGYEVEVVATGFQLPVNIAFVPNPGPNPGDPFYYVAELYGAIKVVRRDGTVGTYASNLLNFNPTGAFPGSGEQGLGGLVVDPVSGDVFASMVYSSQDGVEGAPHYPKVDRFHSTNGGQTAATRTTILNMVGETQGQSHQVSNLSIGPDGFLYLHNGDGFDSNTAQNLSSFRGKVLRMTLSGAAVPANPFYNAGDGISARDYVFAYGFRNPFGGAWRASDGQHYEVENGPSVDRFAKVTRGTNYLWDGSDASMANLAIYNWNPAVAPVNLAFIQSTTQGGSGFPAAKQDHAFVSQSGPTWATGPQGASKSISEFVLDASGNRISGPTVLAQYNGAGKATAVGLAAGPDGLYFSDLYKDLGYASPIDRGANVLRIRYVGNRAPVAVEDSYTVTEDGSLATIGPSVQNLVQTGSVWKYLDNGTNQGTAWRTTGFNDAGWASGPSPLGYGDGDEATVTGFIDTDAGQAGTQRNFTTYFRRTFNVTDVASISSLQLDLQRDDGASIFLNGTEVVRSNMLGVLGDNTITFTSPADQVIADAGEDEYHPYSVTPAGLVEGANVLAVEVHQQNAGSSDISFDLRLTATRLGNGVAANDIDADFNPLTVSLVDSPVHAQSFVLAADGSFTYTPAPNFYGSDSFTYRANDGQADSNIITATINVLPLNDPPLAVPGGPYIGLEGTSLLLNGAGSSDIDDAAGTLIYEWDLNYDGSFQADASGPQPSVTFPDNFPARPIALRVTDPGNLSNLATTTLRFDNVAPAVNAGPDASVSLGQVFSAVGSFADSGADTWTGLVDYGDGAGFLPLSIQPGKTFELSKMYSAVGDYTVQVRITDDDGAPGSDALVVHVAVPSSLVVTNTDNDGPGSLRRAVETANADSGSPHTIIFDIPSAIPHAIQLSAPLPAMGDPVSFEIPAGQTVEIGTVSPFSLPDVAQLTKTGAGQLIVGGNQVHAAGSLIEIDAGVLRLQSDPGFNASLAVRGQLEIDADVHLAGLSIETGGLASVPANGNRLVVVDSLFIDAAAALDLVDNDLAIRATLATRDAVLAQVLAWVGDGFDQFAWTGLGMRSQAAADDESLLTALGVMQNDNGSGGAYHALFHTEPLNANAVIVKYTYYGDADLGGTVDGTDYALIDNGFNAGLVDWFNGDFDFSGSVDGTDYALIDNAFNQQSGALTAPTKPTAVSPASTPTAVRRADEFGSADTSAATAPLAGQLPPATESDLFAPGPLRRRR